jgi:hypothetical protein
MSSGANTPNPPASGGLLTADAMISTSMSLLKIVSAGIQNQQLSAGVEIASEVVPLIEAAIENLIKVRGSLVTLGQLEDMRFVAQW